MPAKLWTQEEDEVLKKLVKLGKSTREIALVLRGRTHYAIEGKKKRMLLTVPLKFWTPQEIKKLKTLRKQGHTYRDIADNLGRSYMSVDSKIKSLSLPPLNYQPDIDYEMLNLIEGDLCED